MDTDREHAFSEWLKEQDLAVKDKKITEAQNKKTAREDQVHLIADAVLLALEEYGVSKEKSALTEKKSSKSHLVGGEE